MTNVYSKSNTPYSGGFTDDSGKEFARNSKGSVRPVISLPVAYTAMLSNATIHGQIAIQS